MTTTGGVNGRKRKSFGKTTEQKKELKDSIDPLQVEKEKLAKSLQDKYGEGSIDTSTGEFIKQN